jgi:DNA-binding LacI/PurR family transcriptional regulator
MTEATRPTGRTTRPGLAPADPVTLEQVAKAAGVSRATASRVINDGVASKESVKAVNRAIKRLGYVPNRAARTLARHRTDAVALVTPESPSFVFLDPFLAVVISTVSQRLWRAGLQPLLVLMDPDDPMATTKRFLHRSNVDGMIVTHYHHDEQIAALLGTMDLPAVFIGRPPVETAFPYVDADNVHGGYVATKHLLDQGRHKIACLGGPLTMSPAIDRRAGFNLAHSEAGVEPGPYVELPSFHPADAVQVARRLIEDYPEADAIMAQSDTLGAAAINALVAVGRTVPDDVAVVGYDDSVIATQIVPNLTTVAQPVAQLGEHAADLMIGRLETGVWADSPRILPIELIVRQSA